MVSAYGCGSTSLATEWVLGMNGQNTNHCGNTILNANEWFHIAVTQHQDSVRFYVNGQLDNTMYEPIAISRTFAKLKAFQITMYGMEKWMKFHYGINL